ncbi:MAG TPA: hypothetical protein PKI08_09235, partial [Aquaticitalea sp.]|nr:hypothetical protein [Aquaticitalea sp.]
SSEWYIRFELNGELKTHDEGAFSYIDFYENGNVSSISFGASTNTMNNPQENLRQISMVLTNLRQESDLGVGTYVISGYFADPEYNYAINLTYGGPNFATVSTEVTLTIDQITDVYISGTFSGDMFVAESPDTIIYEIRNGDFKLQRND